jgi:hypothetical protein
MRYDGKARGGSLAGRLSPSVHLRGWWIERRPLSLRYRNVSNSYDPDRNCPPWELCPSAAGESLNAVREATLNFLLALPVQGG